LAKKYATTTMLNVAILYCPNPKAEDLERAVAIVATKKGDLYVIERGDNMELLSTVCKWYEP
jgi:hypothetical protein